MTEIIELLDPQRISCKCKISSKKKALQTVAELLGSLDEDDEVSEMDYLDALTAREKLGSTGLGHGVSLPHGRIKGLRSPFASLITLSEGIDYDAPDDERVDIVMGLVVPEHCNDEHLKILAALARAFSSETLRNELRSCENPEQLLNVLDRHRTAPAADTASGHP